MVESQIQTLSYSKHVAIIAAEAIKNFIVLLTLSAHVSDGYSSVCFSVQ